MDDLIGASAYIKTIGHERAIEEMRLFVEKVILNEEDGTICVVPAEGIPTAQVRVITSMIIVLAEEYPSVVGQLIN